MSKPRSAFGPFVTTAATAIVLGTALLPACRPNDPAPASADLSFGPITVEFRQAGQDPTVTEVIAIAADARLWRHLASKRIAFDRVLTTKLDRDGAEMPPILGSYRVQESELIFAPALPLMAGERYVASFSLDRTGVAGVKSVRKVHQTPARRSSGVPTLTAVQPSLDVLPANHLKFYLHFSEPMREGVALQHCKLFDENGREVPEPFRETELWADQNRRLTLWFHPGRQKRGVNLNVDLGPVLIDGHRYRLVISSNWPSVAGLPLGRDYAKAFTADPPDHTQPATNTWRLIVPAAGTRDPVKLEFPKPMDSELLFTMIRLENPPPGGDGRITADGWTNWSFHPASPWRAGRYRIAVDTALEDLAGNSLARPFEVDVTKSAPAQMPEKVFFEFEVAGATAKK